MLRIMTTPIAAIILAGCAGGSGVGTAVLTPSQCAANWAAVGAADAEDNAPLSKLDDYSGACARGGSPLTADQRAAWLAGWQRGTTNENCEGANCAAPGVATASAAPSSSDEAHRTHHHHHGHHSHRRYGYGPRIFPTFGIGIGIGSRGTRIGSRVGLGIGFGFPLFGHRRY